MRALPSQTDGPPDMAVGHAPHVLRRIAEPGTPLALWRRPADPALATWLDALPPAALPKGRALVDLDHLPDALAEMQAASGTPTGQTLDAFYADIGLLAHHYADLIGSRRVDVRLDAISGDACWRFHRDHVPLRLICTYRGPGTEMVPHTHAAQALADQRDYTGPLDRVDRFDVALFRGSTDGSPDGVVHRSPPIAGAGVTRLMLCLNARSAASPRPWEEAGIETG